MRKILLISLKPQYADKVFDGSKTVELRRTRPKLNNSDLILIYATSPVKAIVGGSEVKDVLSGTPNEIWSAIFDVAGINAQDYREYFLGAKTAFGINLKNSWRHTKPISLDRIKAKIPSFHPPQIYQYMNIKTVRTIDKNLFPNYTP
jgi:predicted transcriptional regulator